MGGQSDISQVRPNKMRREGTAARGRRTESLIAAQHGRITRQQLVGCGWSARAIDGEVQRRRLLVEHKGVYVVGHASTSFEGRVISAVLACGPGAAASHRSAAQLRCYLPQDEPFRDIDVTVPIRSKRRRPGITVHHADLEAQDTRVRDGILTTSPARTLLDLAGASSISEFERAFDEAVFKGRIRNPQIEDVLARNVGRRGSARLRKLWQADERGGRNRSEAEKRMAALIKAAKLPMPTPNGKVGRYIVDFLWATHRVVVETDGFATHGKRTSFEADRARDADLQALGYSVLRFTWRQITRDAYFVVARLAASLALADRDLTKA